MTRLPEPLRLSRDLIIDEAIRLLSEEGLDGVSLRRLGARLGVRAPSLYWHVPDKNALLAAMMERIFLACLDSVPDHHHWRDWMQAFALGLWHTQDGVRDFGRLLIGTPLPEAQISRTEERLRQRLAALDIPVAEALRIQGSVQVLVTGWSIFAHTPYSAALSRRMDFRARALHDLGLLLDGEARRLQSSGAITV
jgi:TetR/AcrR family transcriptional regulator, tetracycline repressor protein